jgi:hypothetical protein
MSSIYMTVVQAVLLYVSESWLLTTTMERASQSFHRKCAWYIAGNHIRPDSSDPEGVTWICPPSEKVLEEAGLLSIEEYILQRRKTIPGYASS